MTTIQLNEFWTSKLQHMPETGMGYQIVDITLRNGQVLRRITVLNGEECQTPQYFAPEDIVEIVISRS